MTSVKRIERYRELTRGLSGSRDEFLTEDYVVFTILYESREQTPEELLATHGMDIAKLLRGEREVLSTQERDEVLRHRIFVLPD